MTIIKPKFEGKMGFEIECVFKSSNSEQISNLMREFIWKSEDDGSINTTRLYRNSGEFKTHTDLQNINAKFEEIKKLLNLVQAGRKYSCGSHIHVSFEDMSIYYKLATWDFVKYFQEQYLKTFKTVDDRWRTTCRWCEFYESKNRFDTVVREQLASQGKSGSRYKVVNFNSFNCMKRDDNRNSSQLKTIEFRIFNGTSSSLKYKRYINFIIKTINTFLKKSKPLEIKIEKNIPNIKNIIIRKTIEVKKTSGAKQ